MVEKPLFFTAGLFNYNLHQFLPSFLENRDMRIEYSGLIMQQLNILLTSNKPHIPRTLHPGILIHSSSLIKHLLFTCSSFTQRRSLTNFTSSELSELTFCYFWVLTFALLMNCSLGLHFFWSIHKFPCLTIWPLCFWFWMLSWILQISLSSHISLALSITKHSADMSFNKG